MIESPSPSQAYPARMRDRVKNATLGWLRDRLPRLWPTLDGHNGSIPAVYAHLVRANCRLGGGPTAHLFRPALAPLAVPPHSHYVHLAGPQLNLSRVRHDASLSYTPLPTRASLPTYPYPLDHPFLYTLTHLSTPRDRT